MAESDSKSSGDETDRSDQNDEYLGSGRSYECTFCKRGFTTAQALGGHMNIHRKDRGKPRLGTFTADHHHDHHNHNPLVYPSKLIDENYASFGSFLGAIQSYPPVHFARSSAPDHQVDNGLNYDLLREKWRGSCTLSLGLGMSHHEEEEEDHHLGKEKISGGDRVEVDLELRLGYDP